MWMQLLSLVNPVKINHNTCNVLSSKRNKLCQSEIYEPPGYVTTLGCIAKKNTSQSIEFHQKIIFILTGYNTAYHRDQKNCCFGLNCQDNYIYFPIPFAYVETQGES